MASKYGSTPRTRGVLSGEREGEVVGTSVWIGNMVEGRSEGGSEIQEVASVTRKTSNKQWYMQ